MLSNPADRKKLYDAIIEISNSMTRADAEKDYQKDAIDTISSELNIEKKYVRKVANVYHKQNYNMVKIENQEVLDLYQLIVAGTTVAVND